MEPGGVDPGRSADDVHGQRRDRPDLDLAEYAKQVGDLPTLTRDGRIASKVATSDSQHSGSNWPRQHSKASPAVRGKDLSAWDGLPGV